MYWERQKMQRNKCFSIHICEYEKMMGEYKKMVREYEKMVEEGVRKVLDVWMWMVLLFLSSGLILISVIALLRQ